MLRNISLVLLILILIPSVSALTVDIQNNNLIIEGEFSSIINIYHEDDLRLVDIIDFQDKCKDIKCKGRYSYSLVNLPFDESYYFNVYDYNKGETKRFNFGFRQGSAGFGKGLYEICSLNEECASGNCVGPEYHCCPIDRECFYNNKCYDVGEFTSNGDYVCSEPNEFQTCEDYCSEQGLRCVDGECVEKPKACEENKGFCSSVLINPRDGGTPISGICPSDKKYCIMCFLDYKKHPVKDMCVRKELQFCDDGTLVEECSNAKQFGEGKPKYCNNALELVDDCFNCGCPSEEQICLKDGDCSEIISLIFKGLATNKKIYSLGEEIKLIDELDILVEESSLREKKEFYLNNPLISEQDKLMVQQMNKYPYNGFIVEFKKSSIFEKRKELEYRAAANEQSWAISLYKIAPAQLQPVLESNIDYKVANYAKELEKEHEQFIFDSFGVFKPSSTQNNIEFTKLFNGVVLDISEKEAKELLKNKNVKSVYPNYLVHMNLMDSVSQINADKVWNLNDNKGDSIDGKGINIVVIDTGIDYTHPDFGSCTKEQFLTGKCEKIKGGYDFINKDNDPYDDHGHGTHVAGIIAADGILKGVSPGVNLYSYKVLNSRGSGSFSGVMSAIEMAADPNSDYNFDDHFDIVSMSLGSSDGDSNDPMSKTVDNAVNAGIIVVVAAGNDGAYGLGTIGSPGTAKSVITVGASCKPEQFYNETINYCNPTYSGEVPGVAWFSSRGPENIFEKPDVVAPGVMICSSVAQALIDRAPTKEALAKVLCIDNKHIFLSGTSMATPHVAGVVALIKQAHPDWTPYQIKAALKNDANPFGYSRLVEGSGQVDALKSVKDNKIYPILNIKEGISEENPIEYKESCCEYAY